MGLPVERDVYEFFNRLTQLTFSGLVPEQEVRTIEALLTPGILAHPMLGPLLWGILERHSTRLSPELVAQLGVLHWEHDASRARTIVRELSYLSPAARQATLQALQGAAEDKDRSHQRRETYREVLAVWEQTERSRDKATQSAEDWVDYWGALVRQDRLEPHVNRSTPLPDIPAGEHDRTLQLLLALNPDDFAPRAECNSHERQRFPWRWDRALETAFCKVLGGTLTEESEKLLVQREVGGEGGRGMVPTHGEYGKAVGAVLQRIWERGELDDQMLAATRRSWQLYPSGLRWVADALTPELNPGEAWSDAFLARLGALPAAQREGWPALVAFARTATASKPSAKWLRAGQKHVDVVGADCFCDVLTATLPLLSRPRTFPLDEDSHYKGNPNLMLDTFNVQSLKGLLWLSPLAADAALARAVAGVVDSALKKIPGIGPREPKLANAAVYALSQMESEAALSALARLNTTVTYKGTLKETEKALKVTAERLGTSPEDLLELGVPTLGLQSVGERVEAWGDLEARLTVGQGGARLSFSREGKALKAVPASVKKDFAEELKELKAAQKEAEGATSALAQRLDSLMIEEKVWRGDLWQERYLNHPLAGTVARRLIWVVDGAPALWHDGELRSVKGHALKVNPDAEVGLWHPIGRDVDEVLAWRDRLEELGVRQPFKQAWREVYLLTDAERRTETYSNRFAGHVLKQHQFNGLAALRGWRNKLRLMVDDTYPPAMRDLPGYGLRAEYWIEGIGEHYGQDTTESGSFVRVVTDQLRFYPISAPENRAHAGGGGYEMWLRNGQDPVHPVPLEQIPPLVLSEVMRDVDLFVGVASVGNDPTWQDGGPGGRFREYWQSYSFGELAETAKTRAEYLARLIPRLKIRERLTLEGRFLKVRGDRRTYKIHLGSGNILMEPNDEYLCIIPGGSGGGPDIDFDGDRVLSLILSKAFLLAEDTKITDPVILAQLGR